MAGELTEEERARALHARILSAPAKHPEHDCYACFLIVGALRGVRELLEAARDEARRACRSLFSDNEELASQLATAEQRARDQAVALAAAERVMARLEQQRREQLDLGDQLAVRVLKAERERGDALTALEAGAQFTWSLGEHLAAAERDVAYLEECHEADRKMWAHGVTRAEEQRDAVQVKLAKAERERHTWKVTAGAEAEHGEDLAQELTAAQATVAALVSEVREWPHDDRCATLFDAPPPAPQSSPGTLHCLRCFIDQALADSTALATEHDRVVRAAGREEMREACGCQKCRDITQRTERLP